MEHNQGRHLPSNIGGAWDIRKGEQEKGRKEEQGEKEKEKKEKKRKEKHWERQTGAYMFGGA